MNKISNKELIAITGGAITSALITAYVRLLNTVIDIGKMIGYTISRFRKKSY